MSDVDGATEDRFLDELVLTVVRSTPDETLAGLLEKAILGDSQGGGGAWGVVDLVNPTQTYYRYTTPAVRHSEAIERKLLFGKYVHEQLAPAWFRELPGFAVAEGSVDGATVGLGGIRGRIDFRLGRSIVEFKTTELDHGAPADVWTKTPQDLEQLLFYALMTERPNEAHWLVYYRQVEADPFRVFQTRILDRSKVKANLLRRKGMLEAAVRTAAPDALGRCRYYSTGCDYRSSSTCHCDRLAEMDTTELRSGVSLERDTTLERELTRVRSSTPPLPRTRVRAWDIFVPRQAFRELTDPKPFEGRTFSEDYNQRVWVERKIADSEVGGRYGDMSVPVEPGGRVSLGWSGAIVVKRSTKEGVKSLELPVLVRVPKAERPKELGRVPDAYLAQLAMRAAILGSEEGVLALVFPRSKYQVLCWRVVFKQQEETRRRIAARLSLMMNSIDRSDYTRLPLCPAWLWETCSGGCLCRPSEAAKS